MDRTGRMITNPIVGSQMQGFDNLTKDLCVESNYYVDVRLRIKIGSV